MGKCWKDGETECDDMPNPDGYVCQEVCTKVKGEHDMRKWMDEENDSRK